MDGDFQLYWSLRQPIVEEFERDREAIEIEISQAFQNAQRHISDLEITSKDINAANLNFIRFFIENKAGLPADYLEYVEAWQKENVQKFSSLQTMRDALAAAFIAREQLMPKLRECYVKAYEKMFHLTHNFTVIRRASLKS